MKFLIADDHALVLEGLRLTLQRAYPKASVLDAATGLDALRLIQRHPDLSLVIADLNMPEIGGIDLMVRVAGSGLVVPFVMLSGSTKPVDIAGALDAGALGYFPKQMPPEAILEGVQRVLEGELYLPATLARELSAWRRTQVGDAISPRQLAVLRLLREGLSNQDIAKRLLLSEATVKTHVAGLLRALNAENRTACVLAAIKQGLIS